MGYSSLYRGAKFALANRRLIYSAGKEAYQYGKAAHKMYSNYRGTSSPKSKKRKVFSPVNHKSGPMDKYMPVKVTYRGRGQASGARRGVRGKGYSHGPSTYAGKFRKMNKKAGRSFDKFNREGVVCNREITGNISDPDCVHLLSESVSGVTLQKYLLQAILRKLFEKAGITIYSNDSALISADLGVTGLLGSTVRLNGVNVATGAISWNVSHAVVVGDTLAIVAGFFEARMNEFVTGGIDNALINTEEPKEFLLYQDNGAITHVMSTINCDEITVHYKSHLDIKVQNRTLAIDGSGDAENVAANPLQGYQYYFKGLPRVKGDRNVVGVAASMPYRNFMTLPGTDAVKTIVPVSSGDGLCEPVSPGLFINCKKAARIRMDPGQVKRSTLSAAGAMSFFKILKFLRHQEGSTAEQYSYSPFPSLLITLEDVINVNALEEISIAFEVERKFGIYISMHKRKWCRTILENNVV